MQIVFNTGDIPHSHVTFLFLVFPGIQLLIFAYGRMTLVQVSAVPTVQPQDSHICQGLKTAVCPLFEGIRPRHQG